MKKRAAAVSDIPLPSSWPANVCHSVIAAVGLAWVSMTHVRGWAINSPIERLRLKAENERLLGRLAVVEAENRILKARLSRVPARERPYYTPEERLEILSLRTGQGWSASQTARRFLVSAATIASWTKRLQEGGESALLRLSFPVNKFSECVTAVAQQLRVAAPLMGSRKIAEHLARAGLHLSATTVRRMLKQPPVKPPKPGASGDKSETKRVCTKKSPATIVAKRPGHVWNCDLTACPIVGGFWVDWLPKCIRQSWPFAWWLLVVVDHYSRRIVCIRVYSRQPTAVQVCDGLSAAASEHGSPAHLISDQGPQFVSEVYEAWCRLHEVKPRWGAIGQHGSIALTERVILALKSEWLWRLLMPLSLSGMNRVVWQYVCWYNRHRPHRSLGGATPNEVYNGLRPARDGPSYEPRRRYPLGKAPLHGAPRAVRGQRGTHLRLVVNHHEGQQHLPVVELRSVARAA